MLPFVSEKMITTENCNYHNIHNYTTMFHNYFLHINKNMHDKS
jgi:hypothetical protein